MLYDFAISLQYKLQYLNSNMLAKTLLKGATLAKNSEGSEDSLHDSEQKSFNRQQSRLNSLVQMSLMKKQALGVSFSGVIRSGVFKNDNTLCIQFAFYHGSDWELVGGQPSGISLKSVCSEQKIIWNFPFGVTFQTKNIQGWPQLVLITYGTDYYGRSIPKGYGNVHLPLTQGTHRRKIRIFRTLQSNSILNCLNWLTSSPLEIKQPQKYLGEGKQRKSLRVQYAGEVQIEIETRPINLVRHGFC